MFAYDGAYPVTDRALPEKVRFDWPWVVVDVPDAVKTYPDVNGAVIDIPPPPPLPCAP
jgi:hypothetical protein